MADTGSIENDIILLADVCALIMVAPSALIEVCNVTVPIETIEVISPIARPCPSKSRYNSLSHIKCSF